MFATNLRIHLLVLLHGEAVLGGQVATDGCAVVGHVTSTHETRVATHAEVGGRELDLVEADRLVVVQPHVLGELSVPELLIAVKTCYLLVFKPWIGKSRF